MYRQADDDRGNWLHSRSLATLTVTNWYLVSYWCYAPLWVFFGVFPSIRRLDSCFSCSGKWDDRDKFLFFRQDSFSSHQIFSEFEIHMVTKQAQWARLLCCIWITCLCLRPSPLPFVRLLWARRISLSRLFPSQFRPPVLSLDLCALSTITSKPLSFLSGLVFLPNVLLPLFFAPSFHSVSNIYTYKWGRTLQKFFYAGGKILREWIFRNHKCIRSFELKLWKSIFPSLARFCCPDCNFLRISHGLMAWFARVSFARS